MVLYYICDLVVERKGVSMIVEGNKWWNVNRGIGEVLEEARNGRVMVLWENEAEPIEEWEMDLDQMPNAITEEDRQAARDWLARV